VGGREGTGPGNAEKPTALQAVEWGGAGKGSGAWGLRGPFRTVTNSTRRWARVSNAIGFEEYALL